MIVSCQGASGNMRAAKMGLVMVVLAVVLAGALQLPVDVPDTNSPLEGNHTGVVNDANTVGQTLVATRDGLDRVEVTLSVQKPLDQSDITFRIEETPGKQSREVKLPVRDIPIGKVGDFRPGMITERWYSFQFDPIRDSAGKQLYFTLNGAGLPGPNSVSLLMFFHNEYPLGEAYVNGNPVGGHVVFRAYTKGKLWDLVGVLAENMTRSMPGLLGSPITYVGLALTYAILG